MVGQVDGDEASDDSEDDPRSYRNKGVGQRMLIISAGVIMNVILAVICFVIVFRGPGKNRPAGVVSSVDSGSVAFQEGIRTGSVIQRIGDRDNPNFETLIKVVMASHKGQEFDFVTQRPEDPLPLRLKVEPREGKIKPLIGLAPGPKLELENRTYLAANMPGPFSPGSAASKAEPAFAWGDKIIGMTDPATGQVTELPIDPRVDKSSPYYGQRDYFKFWERLVILAGKEITFRVDREGKTLDIKVPPSFNWSLGLRMTMGKVAELRKDSPADKAGLLVPSGKQQGDRIEWVQVKEPGGNLTIWQEANEKTTFAQTLSATAEILSLPFGLDPAQWAKTLAASVQVAKAALENANEKPLDPVRLPFELRQWANRMEEKKIPGPWLVTIQVQRHRDRSGLEFEPKTLTMEWDNSWKFDRALPTNGDSPLAIPELGFAYRVGNTIAGIDPAIAKGPEPGDVVKEFRLTHRDDKGRSIEGNWQKLEPNQWGYVAFLGIQQYPTLEKVSLKVVRSKEENNKEFDIVPVLDHSWPSTELGLIFQSDMRRQWADTLWGAVQLGFSDTHDNVMTVFNNIRSMATGRVSFKLLSGPISIARFAYLFALVDAWEFVFFLGMISINLAVINFLPIPVLDGGHMVFLIYEKLRGKPASEGVRIGATYAGVALILCLMVFVFYLDITRLFTKN